ncbi:MAG TPA: efflux transporter outer membrane subunit [Opitutaceae bacterium]|nr:efflux transporter outer membrane subunit [Opitutaceae bacterium]
MNPSFPPAEHRLSQLRSALAALGRQVLSRPVVPAGFLAVTTFAGCALPAVGPDYRRPAVPTAASYRATADQPLIVAGQLAREWWRDFGDQELDRFIDEALKENQSLKSAVARVEQARALTGAARAAYLPAVAATGLVTREQTSETMTNHFPNSLTTTYRLPLMLSWELDLFGRVRRLNESAQANFRATQELADATRLAIATETASTYFALSATDDEARIVASTLTLQREMLTLIEARRDAGRASDLAVEQARLAVSTSKADLAAVANRRAALKDGLAILVGQPAPSFEIEPRLQTDGSLPPIPVGLPSDLLLRRPDLAAAENKLRATNAQIGAAKAAFFPAISLTGGAGYASAELGDLFLHGSRAWSLTPSIYLPLFQGGRNRANYRRSQAAYEEAVAEYRQNVLTAFGEVQDALSASQHLSEQFDAMTRAVASAHKVRELAEERYLAGGTSYLEVIDAQRTLLTVERGAAALAGQRLITRVALIRALGGGWDSPAAKLSSLQP